MQTQGDLFPSVNSGVKFLHSDSGQWLRRVLAGNPFYLASAGLLLYGINKISTDPRLIGAEHPMLVFNFCALLIYELLLLTTAVVLARRKVWYDALLLVGLANLFIIIPFSLVSRALFLSQTLAWAMCAVGCLFAMFKFWVFQKYIPALNLSRRLLAFGTVILLANAATPMLFKSHAGEAENLTRWFGILWLLVLPALVFFINFIPQSQTQSPMKKPWFPQATFLAWLIVTGFHFEGIGYASGFTIWQWAYLIPSLWVLAWSVRLRFATLLPNPFHALQLSLLLMPAIVTLPALGDSKIFPVLSLLNAAIYMGLLVANRRNRWLVVLMFFSLSAVLATLPASGLGHIPTGFSRIPWLGLAIVTGLLWLAFWSKDPRVALIVAIVLVLTAILLFPGSNVDINPGLFFELGLVFILVHSLGWADEKHRGASLLRFCAGMFWIFCAIHFLRKPVAGGHLITNASALLVLAIHGVRVFLNGSWTPRTVPCFACLILLSEPGNALTEYLKTISPCFVAVLGSFLLFGVGTIAALTKSKWSPTTPAISPPSPDLNEVP